MGCIIGAHFDMLADVLRRTDAPTEETGHWEYAQDEAGDIIRVWIDDTDENTPGTQFNTVRCMVRGVLNSGYQAAGTTEKWDEIFQSVDWAKMMFPADVHITARDQITNVRWERTGEVIWREEEAEIMVGGIYVPKPTIFDVKGVTPVIVPLVGHSENMALLQKAEEQ